MQRYLVTGGTGYIGSHTVLELIKQGYEVVAVDNLSNSKATVLDRIYQITNHEIPFIKLDLCNKHDLAKVFDKYNFDGVIHFAGLKAVGESVAKPLEYYRNNIDSTLALCEVMNVYGVNKLIFSSSATVYGTPSEIPILETSQIGVGITNPYGQTKFMIEQILKDLTVADPKMQVTALRYFNPIGAHESGLIGEDPNGIPNNLLPFVAKVAVGEIPSVGVFGDDYKTSDGTGVRDYIHVTDLARGHIAAINGLKQGYNVYNLGTGKGTSVLEIIKAFEKACGSTINYEIKPRRPGDIANCFANVTKAKEELNWETEKTIGQACEDAWRWQQYAYKNL